MGYRTDFTLTYLQENDMMTKVAAVADELFLLAKMGADGLWAFTEAEEMNVQGDHACHIILDTKWYDWKEDMAALSARLPEVLFTLEGAGDSPGDIWQAYFKGGLIQYWKANLECPPFSPDKLVPLEV